MKLIFLCILTHSSSCMHSPIAICRKKSEINWYNIDSETTAKADKWRQGNVVLVKFSFPLAGSFSCWFVILSMLYHIFLNNRTMG